MPTIAIRGERRADMVTTGVWPRRAQVLPLEVSGTGRSRRRSRSTRRRPRRFYPHPPLLPPGIYRGLVAFSGPVGGALGGIAQAVQQLRDVGLPEQPVDQHGDPSRGPALVTGPALHRRA